jgi:hypothetical protein
MKNTKTIHNIKVPLKAERLYKLPYQSCDCGHGGYQSPVLVTENITEIDPYCELYYTDSIGEFHYMKMPQMGKTKTVKVFVESSSCVDEQKLNIMVLAEMLYHNRIRKVDTVLVSAQKDAGIVISNETRDSVHDANKHYRIKYLYNVLSYKYSNDVNIVKDEVLYTSNYVYFSNGEKIFSDVKGASENINNISCEGNLLKEANKLLER